MTGWQTQQWLGTKIFLKDRKGFYVVLSQNIMYILSRTIAYYPNTLPVFHVEVVHLGYFEICSRTGHQHQPKKIK